MGYNRYGLRGNGITTNFDPVWTQDNDMLTAGEAAMWKAVLTRALQDAQANSRKSETNKAKKAAIAWLTTGGEDFETVCDYGGIDPDYVRGKAKTALANGCQWRLPAGQGWRTAKHREALAAIQARIEAEAAAQVQEVATENKAAAESTLEEYLLEAGEVNGQETSNE